MTKTTRYKRKASNLQRRSNSYHFQGYENWVHPSTGRVGEWSWSKRLEKDKKREETRGYGPEHYEEALQNNLDLIEMLRKFCGSKF